jgi:erythromycin esterase-like protein
MVGFRDQSWNLRDAHMMDVLEAVKNFHGSKSKGIVWAHNTHVGDARYTDMQEDGMLNVGQLVREKHSATSYIVGFASYEGSVIAAKTWGSQMREIAVPPAFRDSLEDVLHRQSAENKLLLLDSPYWRSRFDDFVGHRAIGVVYNPIYESGNYVPTILPHRYDAMIYIDKSTALHPLHVQPNSSQVPETYPFGY